MLPYENDLIIDAFIEQNEEDFQEWLKDQNIPQGCYFGAKLEYCESRPSKFDKFAYNFMEDQESNDADDFNDSEKVRD